MEHELASLRLKQEKDKQKNNSEEIKEINTGAIVAIYSAKFSNMVLFMISLPFMACSV